LFPVQLLVTIYTVTNIIKDSSMLLNMKFFCMIYHITLMIFVFVSFQHYTYGRALQFSLSASYCKFFIGMGYSSAVVFVEAMLMFWFEKLQVTYRGTYIELGRGLNRSFYMVVSISGSFALTLALVIAFETNCTQKEENIDFNPFPKLPVSAIYTCGGYSHQLEALYMATAVLIVCGLSSSLIYQYVNRFKSIIVHRVAYKQEEYDDIEKSCIVAVVGCLTVVVVTIISACVANAGFANLCLGITGVLNGMFIVCSFPWGKKLYVAMFGWFIRRKERMEQLRKKQIQIASQTKSQEFTESPNFTPFKQSEQ